MRYRTDLAVENQEMLDEARKKPEGQAGTQMRSAETQDIRSEKDT